MECGKYAHVNRIYSVLSLFNSHNIEHLMFLQNIHHSFHKYINKGRLNSVLSYMILVDEAGGQIDMQVLYYQISLIIRLKVFTP